ncbi:zinc finger protein 704 [Spea bombifrons]|uniref:zinc finger protein 704 n=1 Tax=Spea bombifrons TaxID=233779 RepID=UPI002349DA65|nr:zinc finger protein 704 [Spea bombifrons]
MHSRRLSKRSVLGSEVSQWEPASDPEPAPVAQTEAGELGAHKERQRPTCPGEGHLEWPRKTECLSHELNPTVEQNFTSKLQMAAQVKKGNKMDKKSSSSGFNQEPEMKQEHRRSICLLEEKRKVVSSNIDVPRARKCADEVDMDKVTAAMVLTSLSTSPVVRSPPARLTDMNGSWKELGFFTSSSSDYWSWGTPSDYSNPSTPSPPLSADSFKHFRSPFHQEETIEETETGSVLFEETIPRKRKNSMKVMFKCLWKRCGKTLSTAAGIKKHIRTIHLGSTGESDDNEGEEDFYYTEVRLNKDSLEGLSSLPPVSPSSPSPPSTAFFPDAGSLDNPAKKESPLITPLSSSAPGTFLLLTSDHAYQASPPVNIPGSKKLHINNVTSFAGNPVSRNISTSYEEHRQIGQTGILSPTRAGMGMRKPRGEHKKCRKVYGMENRDKWCTACRWKKACQRFLD